MLTLFLPLAEVEVWLPGVVVLGFSVGVLTGLFGVGGGFLLTPALKALFGVPYPVAVGTDLVQIFLTGTVSAYRHRRAGNVELRLGLVLGGLFVVLRGVGRRDHLLARSPRGGRRRSASCVARRCTRSGGARRSPCRVSRCCSRPQPADRPPD